MVKVLRSLIHEKIPLELRVQLELLSRRRDIRNMEKQEELMKILRQFNITDITPLGPGTNRYAFKLNGFVVKCATDHDGKIDNLKEFKMAKRLQPDVTKIYEVSENGTLLIAQYIQPFESYGEMLKYADKIRAILTKFSSVYLIGDVGISPKNYSNWGLPVGSDNPVCLDFAYVYEVKSELFICRHCNANAMLLPNKDFTELYCSNPACGKKYLFEDIRARIGNDIHRHEIGDLSEEGYRLRDSFVETELDEQRSNYLIRKKVKTNESNKKQAPKKIVYDNFVMEHSPAYYINSNKEEPEMSNVLENAKAMAANIINENDDEGIVIKATSAVIKSDYENDNEKKADDKDDFEGGIAFSGKIDYDDSSEEDTNDEESEDDSAEDQKDTNDEENSDDADLPDEEEEAEEEIEIKGTVITNPNNNPIDVSSIVEPLKDPCVIKGIVTDQSDIVPDKIEPEKDQQDIHNMISNNLKNNISRAVSTLSNVIAEELHSRAVFDKVRFSIKDKKMYPETFYKSVQNVIFKSLIEFLCLNENEVPNANNNGTHRVYTIPDNIEMNSPVEETYEFIDNIWKSKIMAKAEEASDVMRMYDEEFSYPRGINQSWLLIFKNRIKSKFGINNSGIETLSNEISEVWCRTDDNSPVEDKPEEVVNTEEEPVITNNETSENENNNDEPMQDDELNPNINDEDISVVNEDLQNIDSFIGSYQMDIMDNDIPAPQEEDTTNDEESDEEATEYEYLSVEVYPEDDMDIIRIKSGDAFGSINIPLYVKLNDMDMTKEYPSLADERNGIWDWLIHIIPDMIFRTENPEKYLEINENNEYDSAKVVILGKEDSGLYRMGIYYLQGIFIIDDEGTYHPSTNEDLIMRINYLVKSTIGANSLLSNLNRSMNITDEQWIYDESYILQLIDTTTDTNDDVSSIDDNSSNNDEDDVDATSAAEQAAIDAMVGQENSDLPEPKIEIKQINPEDKIHQMTINQIDSKDSGVLTPIRRNK